MKPTPWQRFVARFLPWYDPDAEQEHLERTERLAAEVGRIASIRIAYRDMGDRPFLERRKVPR